jgi:hypothetical protein
VFACAQVLGCGTCRCAIHVELRGHLSIDARGLVGATITACKNGACARGVLNLGAGSDVPAETYLDCIDPECSFSANAEVFVEDTTATRVSIQPAGPFDDGDVYEIDVVDAAGVSLLHARRAVTYDDGVCGCASLSLDLSP